MAQKKSFKADLNPAMQFISTPTEDEREKTTATAPAPEGYKVNPAYIEKKSRRLQLLMQPSLYDLLKTRAVEEGTSVNNLIHELLERAVK